MNENSQFNIKFELGQNGENIKNLRWDPLEGTFCKCVIDNISINNTLVKIENSNADYSDGKQFDFLTTDPMCFWKNHCNIVETVSICGEINFYEPPQLQMFLQGEKGKVITINEKLNYYENENNLLIKDRDRISNENNLLIKDRERIILENENNRLTGEREVMNTIQELENQYKILLDNKMKSDEELQLIFKSPSWKITKPLRVIKQAFLKLKNRLI